MCVPAYEPARVCACVRAYPCVRPPSSHPAHSHHVVTDEDAGPELAVDAGLGQRQLEVRQPGLVDEHGGVGRHLHTHTNNHIVTVSRPQSCTCNTSTAEMGPAKRQHGESNKDNHNNSNKCTPPPPPPKKKKKKR